jgi:hypothetical protein
MAIYETTPNYVLRQIADESILVPVSMQLRERDCLFVLNPVAGLIYRAIKQKSTMAQIMAEVLENFSDVSESEASSDIQECVDQLIHVEAIIAVTSSGST